MRASGMIASALLGMTSGLVTLPLAYASPPDPTWIPGLYDNADYDDVVGLVTDQTGVSSSSQAPMRIEHGPVARVPLPELDPGPHRVLDAPKGRGPPVDARHASCAVQPKTHHRAEAVSRPSILALTYARLSVRSRISALPSISRTPSHDGETDRLGRRRT